VVRGGIIRTIDVAAERRPGAAAIRMSPENRQRGL
jgi:hypothetical protein